jgi:hypothetical protein
LFWVVGWVVAKIPGKTRKNLENLETKKNQETPPKIKKKQEKTRKPMKNQENPPKKFIGHYVCLARTLTPKSFDPDLFVPQ